MYEIFEKLLAERNVSAYQVSKATGISTSTLSEWKKGKYSLKLDKLQKIADYFGVSLDYLLGSEKKSLNSIAEDDKIKRLQCDKRFIRLQRAVSRMDENTKDKAIKTVEAAFEEFFRDDYVDNDNEE